MKSSTNVKGYRLAEGDVLKMGRLKFRVREIKNSDGMKPTGKVNLSELLLGKNAPQLEDSEEEDEEEDVEEEEETTNDVASNLIQPCRICLSDKDDTENPLISPCKCDGTMKYIHLKCLQQWMRSRLATRSTENAVSFTWKTLNCELCKRPFPNSLLKEGKVIELIDIPKPPCQYLILESLRRESGSTRGLHVLSLYNKSSLKLGRGHDCDFRISDISVSRFHANLKYVNGNFYLEDHSSKFGTVVQIKRPIALDNTGISVQTGRTVTELSIKQPFTLIPSCFRSSSSPFDIYNSTSSPGEVSVLPYNNGIPLSIDDVEELRNRAGLNPILKSPTHKQHSNLMYNHNQLGLNSSCEEEQFEEIDVPSVLNVENIIRRPDQSESSQPEVLEGAELMYSMEGVDSERSLEPNGH